MRAARMFAQNDLRVQDMAVPRIADDEILLRTASAFICGTDMRILQNGRDDISPASPRVLGHELSGTVERVGQAVRGLAQAARVAVAPNMGCAVCDLCVSGHTHLCENYQALGIQLDGGFAEYVRIPAAALRQGNVIELPEEVSFEDAAIAEPLSCVYNGFERCDIRLGDSVLVIGAGPIGILHAKLARAAGAAPVIVTDIKEERLAVCRELVDGAVTVGPADLKDLVATLTRGQGVGACITACASGEAQTLSLELTAVNGKVCLFGGLPKGRSVVPLDTNLVHYKQLQVTGTTRASIRQFRKVIHLIAQKVIALDGMVTARFSLDDIDQAMSLAARGVGLKNGIAFA